MINVRTNRILGRHADIAWPNNGDLIPEIPLARDNYDEPLQTVTLVHWRTWQLEDAISLRDDDRCVVQTKRELDRCFKNVHPQPIESLNMSARQSGSGVAHIDEFPLICAREGLASGALPVLRMTIPDRCGEVVERICKLKACTWKLHGASEGDIQRPETRDSIDSKLQQCISVMLPRHLRALEQVWVRIVAEPHVTTEVSVKFYAGFRGSDVE